MATIDDTSEVPEEKSGICTRICAIISQFVKLKPVTYQSVYSYYIPIAGAVSYSAFSISVFLPDITYRLFPHHSLALANSLLFNAHLGSGLYLYCREHLKLAPQYYRIMYSVYGSLVFNFGSVLLWAVTKTLLPESRVVRTIFALSTSVCMLTIGKEYVDFVDSKTRHP